MPVASVAAPLARVKQRFETLYVAVDGSTWSNRAAALAVELARSGGGRVIAAHAYAAQLHDHRFRQMEGGLPAQFRKEDELNRQRDVHRSLIGTGLRLISDSYLDAVARSAADLGRFERRSVEGRNFRALLDDIEGARADLVLLGAIGLGAAGGAAVGTVCERVVRRLKTDVLVVRSDASRPFARLGVALDGSPESLGALTSALELARAHGSEIELVSSFDPAFHHSVFRAIQGVLSEEAGKVFKFEAQQRLHEEIIDQGLERIYRGHLELGARAAAEAGFATVGSTLLSGKAWVCVERFVKEKGITTLFLGRTGVHSKGELDLGSCPEQLLRGATSANLFLSARTEACERWAHHAAPLEWTHEALARLEKVPQFARPMVVGAVERRAREKGHTIISSDLLDEVRGALHGHGPGGPGPSAGTPAATDGGVSFEPEALARLERIPSHVRPHVVAELTRAARARGLSCVTAAALGELKESMARTGMGCPVHAPPEETA